MRGQRRPTEVACRRCNKKKVRCDAVMGSARCKKCTDERAECTWPNAAGNAQVTAGRVQVKNACDACRRNKSRCERDEGQETAACVRCREENRECTFSPRVRGSRSKQLAQDNTQNTVPSMQPIPGQTPAGVDNMGSSTMSESYPDGRNGHHQRAPMGNDSGYQVNHGVGPSPAYVSYTVSYQRASQGPGLSQARPSNGRGYGTTYQQEAGPPSAGSPSGYRSHGLNAHSQTTTLIPPIDTGALPDVGNAAAATDSRPNSPNRSWWETVMLSSPESEYMSEWDA